MSDNFAKVFKGNDAICKYLCQDVGLEIDQAKWCNEYVVERNYGRVSYASVNEPCWVDPDEYQEWNHKDARELFEPIGLQISFVV